MSERRLVHSRVGEVLQLTRVRLLAFWREPEAMFWVFAFPVLLALALGLAFRDRGVDSAAVGIVGSAPATRLAELLAESPHVETRLTTSLEEGNRWLNTGKVAVLLIPGADATALTLRYDPTRPEGDSTRLRVEDAIQRAEGRQDRVAILKQEVTETGARYIDWLIPGLLGMNLMGTSIWGIGFGIVDARQKKLLKRLLVTPMRRSSYLIAFVLSRLVFMAFEVAILIGFGALVLGMPIRGSLLAIVPLCLLGALCFSAIGLLVAARPRTIEGVSGLMNLVMMPMWLCSGVFFSYERFPEAVQPFMEAIPLTALNNALRAVILDGESIFAQLPESGLLTAWAVVCFAVALRLFRWR